MRKFNRWIAIYLVFTLLFGVCSNYSFVYANSDSLVPEQVMLEEGQASELDKQENNNIKIATGTSIDVLENTERKSRQISDSSTKSVNVELEMISKESDNLYYDENGVLHYKTAYINGLARDYTVQFRIKLTLSGQEKYEKEEIKIFLPRQLFQTRDHRVIGKVSLGIPSRGGTEGFAYNLESDRIVLYNETEKVGASIFNCDITYEIGVENQEIKTPWIANGSLSQIEAALEVGNDLNIEKKKSNSITMQYHSGIGIRIVDGEQKYYDSWQEWWGEQPTDANDYLYVRWNTVMALLQPDQPATFSLSARFPEGEVIGVLRYWGKTDWKSTYQLIQDRKNTIDFQEELSPQALSGQKLKDAFTVSFLVRYPKTIQGNSNYGMSDIVAKVKGLDDGIEQQASSYDRSIQPEYFPYHVGEVNSSIQLDDYLSGEENEYVYVGDLKHRARVVGTPFLIKDNNGQQSYDIEWTQDVVYLNNRQLKEDEYTFSNMSINLQEYDRPVYANQKGWDDSQGNYNYNEWEEYILEYRISKDKEWKILGNIRPMLKDGRYSWYYTKYGTQEPIGFYGNILLEQGIIGVRIKHKSKYAMSTISVSCSIKLKVTSELKQSLNQDRTLQGISTLRVFDDNQIWRNVLVGVGTNYKNNYSFFKEEYPVTYLSDSTFLEQMEQHDQSLYGADNFAQHGISRCTIQKSTNSSVPSGESKMSFQCVDTPVVEEKYLLHQGEIRADIQYKDSSVSSKRVGKMYVLLPRGLVLNKDSISIKDDFNTGAKIIGTEMTDDWRDSGRQMLTVSIEENAGDSYRRTILSYTGMYTEHQMRDYGMSLETLYAYEEVGADIWSGLPDTGGIKEPELMKNLSSESTKKDSILYGDYIDAIHWNYAGIVGNSTWVKLEKDLQFQEECAVGMGDSYTYCVRPSANNKNLSMTNLVVYQTFEGANLEDENRATWKGTLESINLHHAKFMGIDPVVYYAMESVVVDDTHIPNLQDSSIWTSIKPDNLSKVKAVAVDLSRKTDGTPFVLESEKGISLYFTMKAPEMEYKEFVNQEGKYVYHSAWFSGNLVSTQKTRSLFRTVADTTSMYETNKVKVMLQGPKLDISISDFYRINDAIYTDTWSCYRISVRNNEDRDYENVVIEDMIIDKLKVCKITDDMRYGVGESITENPNSPVKLLKDEQQHYQFLIPELESGKSVQIYILYVLDINKVQDQDLIENIATIKSVDGKAWDKDSNHLAQTVHFVRKPVIVQKIWDDNNDAEKKRPSEVTVKLPDDGDKIGKELVLSEKNGWRGVFEDVFIYLIYDEKTQGTIRSNEVQEVDVLDYTSEVYPSYEFQPPFTFIEVQCVRNTYYTGPRCDISVEKVWNDDNDQNGKRPSEVTIKLFANNIDTGKILVLSEDNHWEGTFEQVPIDKGEGKISYTVEEVAVPDYKSEVTGNIDTGFVVTNTYQPPVIKRTISVKKEWQDEDNKEGKRPTEVTIKLLANNKDTGKTLVLREENSWIGNFEEVVKCDELGIDIQYSVEEVVVPDYKAEITGDMDNGFVVTNTYQVVSVPPIIEEKPSTSIPMIPLVPASPIIPVTPIVLIIPEDNTKVIEEPEIVPTRTIMVTKEWDDKENKEKKRPNEVKIKLLKNGKLTEQELILSEENSWKGSFFEVLKYEDGKEITYSVEEVQVPNYKSEVTGNMDNGFVITNRYINQPKQEVRELLVQKKWDDENNAKKYRPHEVTIQLLVDGKKTGKTLILSEENHWKDSFKNLLQKDSFGKDIVYSIEELPVPHYTTKITGNMQDGFTVMNTSRDTWIVPKEEETKSSTPTVPEPTVSKKDKPRLDLELNKKKEELILSDSPRMIREVLKNIELYLQGNRGGKLGELELEWLKKNGIEVPSSSRMTREVLRQIEMLLQGRRSGKLDPMNLRLQQGLQGGFKTKVVKTYDSMKLGMYSICFVSTSVLIIGRIWKRKKLKK